MKDEIFKFKTPNFEKMRLFGFQEEQGKFVLRMPIFEEQFVLTVRISADGSVNAELLDALTEEPYTLHLVEEAAGEFVGRVREEYRAALQTVAEKCFETEIFKSAVTKELIARVREKYGDEPEYLWEKFPDNAIWRRKDNQKWYGAVLTVARAKIGLSGEGNAEILDVRADPAEIELLVDNVKVFRGWHMNKKHWISLPLDGSVDLEEIENFLEESWHIAGER